MRDPVTKHGPLAVAVFRRRWRNGEASETWGLYPERGGGYRWYVWHKGTPHDPRHSAAQVDGVGGLMSRMLLRGEGSTAAAGPA